VYNTQFQRLPLLTPSQTLPRQLRINVSLADGPVPYRFELARLIFHARPGVGSGGQRLPRCIQMTHTP
jgi:hypothetical protein